MLTAVAVCRPEPVAAAGAADSVVADLADPWLVAAHAVAAVCWPEPVAAVLVSEALPIVPVSAVSRVGPGVRQTERPMQEAKTEQWR